MRLPGAILSSLVAVSLAAAEPAKRAEPKEQTKADTKEQPKAKPAAAKAKKAENKKAEKKGAADKGEKNEKNEKVSKEILDSYAAIPLNDRVAIQSDLIWTGDYNGVLSGEFGERSVAAVKAFQKRKGGKETGVLNQPERAALSAAAKPKQETVGWRIVDDPAQITFRAWKRSWMWPQRTAAASRVACSNVRAPRKRFQGRSGTPPPRNGAWWTRTILPEKSCPSSASAMRPREITGQQISPQESTTRSSAGSGRGGK